MSAAAAVFTTPVRPDLAGVQPIYYPIIEQKRFGSVGAMCRRMGFPVEVVRESIERAQLERSGLVVVDRLVLGDAESGVCAVLLLQPGGGVVLCAGLFNERSEAKEDVQAMLAEFEAQAGFKGKLLAVGEFRPNAQRVPS